MAVSYVSAQRGLFDVAFQISMEIVLIQSQQFHVARVQNGT